MRIDLLNGSASVQEDAVAPIAWYEGMQLLPQHFQIWDARLESLLRRQMLAAHPFSWGIDRLTLDRAALSAGTLRVLSVAGQFPDGLIFACDAQQDGSLEHTLATDSEKGPVRYALVLPSEDFNENGINVERYRQFVGAPVADRSNRDEKAVITRWRPNLCIRKWDLSNTHYMQIPFVEIVKTAGGFETSGYHPPAVRLLKESACVVEIMSMVQALRSKAKQLDALPIPPLLEQDHRNGLAPVLMALVAGLPRLEAQLSCGVAHPYEILLSLCSMAGPAAALTGKAPDLFPAYAHTDPAMAILAVVRYITGIVNGIGVDHRQWKEIPLALKDGRWICAVPHGIARQELLLRVVVSPSQSDMAISSWLDHTLICWEADESRCRELRIKGLVRRQHVALPELGLSAMPAQRYVHVYADKDIDLANRRLIIGVPDERGAVVVTGISFMMRT